MIVRCICGTVYAMEKGMVAIQCEACPYIIFECNPPEVLENYQGTILSPKWFGARILPRKEERYNRRKKPKQKRKWREYPNKDVKAIAEMGVKING